MMTNRIEQDDCVYMLDFIFKFVGMLNGVTIKYFVSQLDLHHFHSQFACSSEGFSGAQIRIDLCVRKYVQFEKRLCVNINVEYVCHIPLNFYYESKQSKLVILILSTYTDVFLSILLVLLLPFFRCCCCSFIWQLDAQHFDCRRSSKFGSSRRICTTFITIYVC